MANYSIYDENVLSSDECSEADNGEAELYNIAINIKSNTKKLDISPILEKATPEKSFNIKSPIRRYKRKNKFAKMAKKRAINCLNRKCQSKQKDVALQMFHDVKSARNDELSLRSSIRISSLSPVDISSDSDLEMERITPSHKQANVSKEQHQSINFIKNNSSDIESEIENVPEAEIRVETIGQQSTSVYPSNIKELMSSMSFDEDDDLHVEIGDSDDGDVDMNEKPVTFENVAKPKEVKQHLKRTINRENRSGSYNIALDNIKRARSASPVLKKSRDNINSYDDPSSDNVSNIFRLQIHSFMRKSSNAVLGLQKKIKEVLAEVDTLHKMIQVKEYEWNKLLHLHCIWKIKEEIISYLVGKKRVIELQDKHVYDLDVTMSDLKELEKFVAETMKNSPAKPTVEHQVSSTAHNLIRKRANMNRTELEREKPNIQKLHRILFSKHELDDSHEDIISSPERYNNPYNSPRRNFHNRKEQNCSPSSDGHDISPKAPGLYNNIKKIMKNVRDKNPQILTPKRNRKMNDVDEKLARRNYDYLAQSTSSYAAMQREKMVVRKATQNISKYHPAGRQLNLNDEYEYVPQSNTATTLHNKAYRPSRVEGIMPSRQSLGLISNSTEGRNFHLLERAETKEMIPIYQDEEEEIFIKSKNVYLINTKRKSNENSIPLCQSCNDHEARFLCAGCGNQWYCSRHCQVSAWDKHAEICK